VTHAAGIPDRGEQSYPGGMIDEVGIRRRWEAIGSKLDERAQRMFAAAEVRTAGRGGLKAVSRITGLARSTIDRGENDLDGEPTARGPRATHGWRPQAGGGQRPGSRSGSQTPGGASDKRRSRAASDLGIEEYG